MSSVKPLSENERLFNLFRDLNNRADYPVEKVRKKVAFFATPRSGSNLFCDVLESTHCFGVPQEWIASRVMRAYADFFGIKEIPINEYLNFLLRKTTSQNGIFSIKIQINHYQQLLEKNINILDFKFDHIYYLYRENKIEQGYSFAKSQLTNHWRSDVSPGSSTPETIKHSFILDSLTRLLRLQEFYQQHLKHLVEVEFCYEDFQYLEKTNCFNILFDKLGITEKPDIWTSDIKKTATNKDKAEIENLLTYLLPNRSV